jgi:fructan beta-fructosidase
MRRRTVLGGGVAVAGALVTVGTTARPAEAAAPAPGYYDEPYRPQYHFSAEMNWLNDPNGLVWYEGEYHLFYQHNPVGMTGGGMHWGHAVSRDLVRWTHLPLALFPDPLGEIWSGSAVVDRTNSSGFFTGSGGRGLVAIFTHAGHPQQQSIAYSRDRGRTWTKYAGNPVIANPGDNDFRDPKVFWHAPTGRWVMIVAGGRVRIYSSADLIHWTLESSPAIFTECPDLFPLPVDGGGTVKWVLSMGGAQYHVGSFDGRTFTSEGGPFPVDSGPDFYAAQSFSDMPDGRRVWLAWMRGDVNSPQTTFMGRMTIPREVGLRTLPAGVRMVQKPIAELAANRTGTVTWGATTVAPGGNLFAGITGDCYEIQVEFQANGAAATEFGLRVRTGQNGGQFTIIGYDRVRQQIFVDKDRGGGGYVGRHVAAMAPDGGGRVRLRVFVDRSSIEVFGNDDVVSFTELSYPDPASQGLELYAVGGTVTLTSARLDRMRRTWGVSPLATTLTQWTDVRGDWADTAYGRQGRTGAADGFSLAATTGGDFTYEGDIRVLGGYAGALVFRSDPAATACYVANVDVGNQGVKVFRIVGGAITDLGWRAMALSYHTTYHLRVVTAGASIKVYLGDTLVHDLQDSSSLSGRFGLNVYNGTAAVQNVVVNGTPITRYEAGNLPGAFVRHANSRGRVDANPVPYADSQWRLVRGLADPAGVSFASVNFPGEYLRHRDGEIWKDPDDGTALFRADATWFRRPGLADVTLMSFESANYPGEFIAHHGNLLYRDPTVLVAADQEFRVSR